MDPNSGIPGKRSEANGILIRYLDAQGRLTKPQYASKKVVSWFDAEQQRTKISIEFSQHGFPADE
jgi:hypothetical protein